MNKNLQRALFLALIAVGCTLVVAALYLVPSMFGGVSPLYLAELSQQDQRVRAGRMALRHPELVFLGIDAPSYEEELFPEDIEEADPADRPALKILQTKISRWSRALHARAAEKLIAAGAKVVVFDLIFSGPDDGDEALREVLAKYKDHIVIGSNIKIESGEKQGGSQKFERRDAPSSFLLDPPSPVTALQEAPPGDAPPLSDHQTFAPPRPEAESAPVDSIPIHEDTRVGCVNYEPDVDGSIRRIKYRWSFGGIPNDSIVARAIQKYGKADKIPPGQQSHAFRFAGPPGEGYEHIPYLHLFVKSYWESNFQNGEFFKGKIVLIGPAANFLHDYHPTPFPLPMLGPEIHLNALGATLQGEFLRETSGFQDILLMAAGGFLAWLLVMLVRQPLIQLGTLTALGTVWLGFSHHAYNNLNLYLFTVPPLCAFVLSGLVGLVYEFVLERIEKSRVRSTLERYVSRNLVGQILDSPKDYLTSLVGIRKHATIFFSDVRGFTTLTESVDSHALVAQLNEYFSAMVDCVFRHKGTIDKFIGDAIMAVWGSVASDGHKQDACHAIEATLDMIQELARLNEKWRAEGKIELHIGIGINCGEVIVGNMGSQQKMEFTVIGDAVNLASRLEGVTKEYSQVVAIGENLAELVKDDYVLRTLDLIRVKGKTKPVEVFTILGRKGEVPQDRLDWLSSYEMAVKEYRARNFVSAILDFKACLKGDPQDQTCKIYLDRSEVYIKDPPGTDWDGAFVMTSK